MAASVVVMMTAIDRVLFSVFALHHLHRWSLAGWFVKAPVSFSLRGFAAALSIVAISSYLKVAATCSCCYCYVCALGSMKRITSSSSTRPPVPLLTAPLSTTSTSGSHPPILPAAGSARLLRSARSD